MMFCFLFLFLFFFLLRILKSIQPKFYLPGAVSSLAPWTDPYLIFLMAAISCSELWSALLRLGEFTRPGLQSREISGYYINISPYLCFTQKCQIQLWMKHPGKGSVSLCALGSASRSTRGMVSVSGPSSASLNSNFVPRSAWNPPGFIAAKLLLGVSDQVGFVVGGVTTPPVSPAWDQTPRPQPFPASPDMLMAATSPGVPCTRISPQKYHLISLLG